ncbi:MAG: T9SS type A sorting domain-containing protein [Ignavibacteriales bacterium]|nr:T9SS type A sorting domain-containing protein [Ignavibacteriales bacterium]
MTTIFFNDSLNGWIAGQPFDLSFTDDGGLNWNPANVDTGAFSNFPISKIKFSSSQYGFAAGGAVDVAGVVWRYNNSANLWKAYGIAPDRFDDFIFIDSTTTLTLTADIERLYPIGVLNFDVKQSFWNYTELNKYGRVTSISRRTENEYWCTLGCDSSFLVSFDNLNTWEFVPTKDSICINAIAFGDSLHGIAVGQEGNIFRYIPDKPVNIENLKVELPNSFVLDQNYPNPFNPSTSIQYAISSRQFVTLIVYDALGKEIATLVNEEKPAGSYEVQFYPESSIKNPASGVYFYQLRVGDFVETRKMILLK